METRFQNIHRELEALRNGQPSTTIPTPITATQTTPVAPLQLMLPALPMNVPPVISLPLHLISLRNVLAEPLTKLQNGKVEMTADEAAILWE